MRKSSTVLLLLTLTTIAYSSVKHQSEYLHFIVNQASLSYTKADINYSEFHPGNKVLDQVQGRYPGFQLGLVKSLNSFLIDVSANFSKNELDYIGSAGGKPLTAKSTNTFFESKMQLGYIIKAARRTNLVPIFAVGYRNWLREVPPAVHFLGLEINGYTENYINWNYGFGLKLQQVVGDFGLEPYFLLGSTYFPSIRTNIPLGATVLLSQPLGQRFYYNLGLNLYYFSSKNVSIHLGLSYSMFRFGRSPDLMISGIGSIFEPKSQTQTFKVILGISFRIPEVASLNARALPQHLPAPFSTHARRFRHYLRIWHA